MNLILAIGLIWLAFAAGYCLSGMLGAGTREELEREISFLQSEKAALRISNENLWLKNEALRRENEKSKV